MKKPILPIEPSKPIEPKKPEEDILEKEYLNLDFRNKINNHFVDPTLNEFIELLKEHSNNENIYVEFNNHYCDNNDNLHYVDFYTNELKQKSKKQYEKELKLYNNQIEKYQENLKKYQFDYSLYLEKLAKYNLDLEEYNKQNKQKEIDFLKKRLAKLEKS